jgi:hypothetical protein
MREHTPSPEIHRFSARRVKSEFDETLRWMTSLGIKTNSGRLRAYEKAISIWATLPSAQNSFGAHKLSRADQSAILASDKFIDVYRAFHQTSLEDLGGIVDKLKKSIGGPADVADETDKSSHARNFLFEAVVAAKFHCPNQGIHVFLDAPSDTGLTYLSRRIFVECKRLGSLRRIESNVRKACDQLAIALDADCTSRHGGLVAVDISNIISMDEKVADETLLTRHTAKRMDQFIESSSADWQKVYSEKDPRIFGAIFRLSRFVQSETDGLWVISTEWAVNPRQNLGWSETRYMQRLARALQSAAREQRHTKKWA